MQVVTMFRYATGTPEEIKAGNVNHKRLSKKLAVAVEHFPKQGSILIPYVIGVYQKIRLVRQKGDESNPKEIVALRERGIREIARILGKEDENLSIELIQVGYDSGIGRDFIEPLLGPVAKERVLIVPYTELKDNLDKILERENDRC